MSQGTLKAFAIALLVFGVVIILLGMMLLVMPGRAGKGIILIAVGAGLIGFAVLRLNALAVSPSFRKEDDSVDGE